MYHECSRPRRGTSIYLIKKIASSGLRWIGLSSVIFALDYISKQWIVQHFWFGKSVSLIPCVNFTYASNSGAAFSFLADKGGWQRWVFSVIAMAVSAVLLVMMSRLDSRIRLSNAAYAMIIGGALGNLFDRIVYGVVIDFIDFHIANWHWPTFNIADASICIGAVLVFLEGLFSSTNTDTSDKKGGNINLKIRHDNTP